MRQIANPFPGLRPFDSHENHLFFGREQIIDELLTRLRKQRFLAVVGSSGCGKSSVVRAGMIPALHGGYMTRAGSSWRVATMRPGADPLGNLARALNEPGVLDSLDQPDATGHIFRETTLRRSRRGLVDAITQAGLIEGDNVLILVDQFEELFRFKRCGPATVARDEALAFVKRLLSAAHQDQVPVYIVITMRSDFVGDCLEYPELPAALNEGQFLIPRMKRQELRQAICGPVAIGGGAIAPRLVVRLLNEVGDDPDQLPILQHALMRSWNRWASDRAENEAIDLRHYDAIGTMAHALSRHAEEAYHALRSEAHQRAAQKIFKALTDAGSGQQGVRRPTTVAGLQEITGASVETVCAVIECFRQPGTSFLMPPDNVPLEPATVVDISHESLMRGWDRLRRWTREEQTSAATYLRIAEAAAHYDARSGGLWRPPELDIGLRWRETTQPTEPWALRYHAGFDSAMAFLDHSRSAWQQEVAARERGRRLKLRAVTGAAVSLLVFSIALLAFATYAVRQKHRAEANFTLARDAGTQLLNKVSQESLRDVPQMEEVRRDVAALAQALYGQLAQQSPSDDDLLLETLLAQRILAEIHKLKNERAQAREQYRTVLAKMRDLVERHPDNLQYQFHLAATYNQYGEFARQNDATAAEQAFRNAIELQQALVERAPDDPVYQHDLALSYNNLGIVLRHTNRAREAEQMYRAAISGFESALALRPDHPADAFRLAQSYNNLAIILGATNRVAEGVTAYETAIEIISRVPATSAGARERAESLATFYNNLGNYYERLGQYDAAARANREATQRLQELARPIPHLSRELANNYNTRGVILERLGDMSASLHAYQQSIDILQTLRNASTDSDPQLDERLGNAMANLGRQYVQAGRSAEAITLLDRAIEHNRAAMQSAAASAGAGRSLANTAWILAEANLQEQNHVAAAAAANTVAANYTDKDYYFGAATLLARAANVADGDASLDEQTRTQVVDTYATQSVELLHKASAAGLQFDPAQIATGPFRFLAQREDFRELMNAAATP